MDNNIEKAETEQELTIRTAIIEDSEEDANTLYSTLEQYFKNTRYSVKTTVFSSGRDFLNAFQAGYDLVFMDIEMPELDGMAAAKALRETDKRVGLIFVTNMPQYAIKGYEVSALDYLIKPVSLTQLSRTLDRVLSSHSFRHKEPFIMIPDSTKGVRKLLCRDIVYIIKEGNYLVFYTQTETIKVRGTMRDLEKSLAGETIMKCANGCMVNVRHIMKMVKNEISIDIGGKRISLTVTKPYRQLMVKAMMKDIRENR